MSELEAALQAALKTIDEWDVPLHAAAVVTGAGASETLTAVLHGSAEVCGIASVTKAVVSYAALMAVEEGLFNLDDSCGPMGSTVRHLLSHASGLPFEQPETSRTVPQTRRVYSNIGFEVLGEFLTERAEMPVAEYLRLGIFEPLSMSSTHLTGSPAKDLCSTVPDLVLFTKELMRPTLLAPKSVEAMRTVQFPDLAGVVPGFGSQRPCPWGLGLEIKGFKTPHWTAPANSPATFGHFGGSGSLLWVDPVIDTAFVCLTNRNFGPWAPPLWNALGDRIVEIVANYGPKLRN